MMLMMLRNIRYRTGVWQWLAVLFLGVGMLSPAYAGVQEFSVLAVGIDQNETKAKEYALDYARKRAVYLAIRKLDIKDASARAAAIPPKEMDKLIRGATVLQTKRIDNKTYAQVTVSISDNALRKLLDIEDAASVTDGGVNKRNVLVLPAIVLPEKSAIWGKENLLRAPLSTELLRQSHGAVILPGGDLQDLRLIDVENMKTVTMAEMKPMFERYGVTEIIIAIATPSAEGSGDASTVVLRRLNALNPKSERFELSPEKNTDSLSTRLEKIAHSIATVSTEIATSTAADDRAKLTAAKKVSVTLHYAIPKELAQIQAAVRSTPGVLSLELPIISLSDASGTIYIEGDADAVRAALGKKDVIVRGTGEPWILSTR
jgi:hypothetical protein